MTRSSDDKDKLFNRSHDKQIYDTKHDEIVVWLYEKLKAEPLRCKALLGLPDSALPTDLKFRIEAALQTSPPAGSYQTARVVGFVDLMAYTVALGSYEKVVCVEVKTSVNLGETIRQINYYRAQSQLAEMAYWYVCAPPFKGSTILEEQGIGFIPYESEP